MIQPTVGRIVWYYPDGWRRPTEEHEPTSLAPPLAAIITKVWKSRLVNLVAFSADGVPNGITSLLLVQPEDPAPKYGIPFCQWMPYQITKGYGSESAEKAAGIVDDTTTTTDPSA